MGYPILPLFNQLTLSDIDIFNTFSFTSTSTFTFISTSIYIYIQRAFSIGIQGFPGTGFTGKLGSKAYAWNGMD